MKTSLLSLLGDPVLHLPLRLMNEQVQDDEIISGTLLAQNNVAYSIRDGIPCFAISTDEGQNKTNRAFQFLWKESDTFSSPAAQESYTAWLIENYGFASLVEWIERNETHQRILDLGCGRGYASSAWLTSPAWSGKPMWVGIDITEAIDMARRNLGQVANTHFVQGDALALPFADGVFDLILSQGVLHHTPSTQAALNSAARVLASGGEFHFYVYRRKGAVREFTDDYIRDQISALSDEDAWEAMQSLTQLGKVLWETGAQVEIENDIPLLGIKAGKHNVQRLIYWNFAKLYWNPGLDSEANVHVNFDWYRPRYAHRQTADEVCAWCADAGLDIRWFHEQESGFSVKAVKL